MQKREVGTQKSGPVGIPHPTCPDTLVIPLQSGVGTGKAPDPNGGSPGFQQNWSLIALFQLQKELNRLSLSCLGL